MHEIIDIADDLSYFDQCVEIYESSFEDDERESEQSIFDRIKSGYYKLIAFKDKGQIIGFYILDLVKPFGVITYLVIKKEYRGRGLGSELLKQGIAYFQSLKEFSWLLIEAKYKQSLLYEKLGFKKLDFFYGIPAFNSDKNVVKMNLLLIQKDKQITQKDLKTIITQIFTQGYRLKKDDERLLYQLSQIPDNITFTKV